MKNIVSPPARALLAMMALTTTLPLHAQEEPRSASSTGTAAPYAEVQSSTLTGSTNVINLNFVPVVKTNGSIVYENLTVPLEVTENAAGTITVTAGTVTTTATPLGSTTGFQAGTYYGPGSSATKPYQVIALSGPGQTGGGATEWSLAATPTSTSGCSTYPYSATFFVGPLTSNPYYSRLKAAGITSTAYSYGIQGGGSCVGGWWSAGAILGFSQTANSITIVSFSDGPDRSTPGAQITYSH